MRVAAPQVAAPRLYPVSDGRLATSALIASQAGRPDTIEQGHRGVKGRTRCMRGFKGFASAERFCRGYDELRDFLRLPTRHNQHVPANRRRLLHLHRATAALAILEAA